ncbi:MAG: LamG domain-containing protein [Candidatus Cloacimonetes bacterium]|nr:LamG domain-containing protein [Candidatus Cloacimonadota bacterium]
MNKMLLVLFIVLFAWKDMPATSPRNLPTDGLVAHYPLNRNADDASGNGHHGTVYGATLCTDRFGNPHGAYHFVAAQQNYIQVPDDPQLRITNNLSISIWVKHSATSGIFEDIVMKGNDSYGFQFNNNTNEVLFHLKHAAGSWKNLNSLYVPVTGEWFHIAGTYDGSTQRVYINGIQTNTANWSGEIGINMQPLDFGRMVASDNAWYNGDLDDFRIYNRVLSAAEILALYNGQENYVSAPSNVSLTHSDGNVLLSWQAVSGADSYQVYSSYLPY